MRNKLVFLAFIFSVYFFQIPLVSAGSLGAIFENTICTSNGGSCSSFCRPILDENLGVCKNGGYCCSRNDEISQKIWAAQVKSTVSDPELQKQALESVSNDRSLNVNSNFNYQLLEKIPGQSADASLPNYVKAILNAALILIVLSAVFMAMVGGFLYLTSAGNTSRAGTAKDIIVDAIIGLGLALLAYLILYVINPDLVNLRISQLSVTTPKTEGPATTPATTPTGAIAAGCPAGIPCTSCSGCEVITGVDNKGCGASQCYLNSALLSKIKSISGVSGWRITESWPPTVTHMSTCHQNGTCADLNNSGGATDTKTIKMYYDAFRAAGLDVLYESKGCALYEAAGVTNCKSYPTMTNQSSFHVK